MGQQKIHILTFGHTLIHNGKTLQLMVFGSTKQLVIGFGAFL
jgi:6-phosphogluconolactonase/glucosamine-6-phosphate isomerase/deaminase